MASRAQYMELAEALVAAARPFEDLPLATVTRGSLMAAAGLVARAMLRQGLTPQQQEETILAASDRLMRHIVEFLELHATEQEQTYVLTEAEAVLRQPRSPSVPDSDEAPPTPRPPVHVPTPPGLTRLQRRVFDAVRAAYPEPILVRTVREQWGIPQPWPIVAALVAKGLVVRVWKGQYGLVVPDEPGEGEQHV